MEKPESNIISLLANINTISERHKNIEALLNLIQPNQSDLREYIDKVIAERMAEIMLSNEKTWELQRNRITEVIANLVPNQNQEIFDRVQEQFGQLKKNFNDELRASADKIARDAITEIQRLGKPDEEMIKQIKTELLETIDSKFDTLSNEIKKVCDEAIKRLQEGQSQNEELIKTNDRKVQELSEKIQTLGIKLQELETQPKANEVKEALERFAVLKIELEDMVKGKTLEATQGFTDIILEKSAKSITQMESKVDKIVSALETSQSEYKKRMDNYIAGLEIFKKEQGDRWIDQNEINDKIKLLETFKKQIDERPDIKQELEPRILEAAKLIKEIQDKQSKIELQMNKTNSDLLELQKQIELITRDLQKLENAQANFVKKEDIKGLQETQIAINKKIDEFRLLEDKLREDRDLLDANTKQQILFIEGLVTKIGQKQLIIENQINPQFKRIEERLNHLEFPPKTVPSDQIHGLQQDLIEIRNKQEKELDLHKKFEEDKKDLTQREQELLGKMEGLAKEQQARMIEQERIAEKPLTKKTVIETVKNATGISEQMIENLIDTGKSQAYQAVENKLRSLGLNESADALVKKKVNLIFDEAAKDKSIQPLLAQIRDCSGITNPKEKLICEEENKNLQNGIYGDYLRCNITMNKIEKNFAPDLTQRYIPGRSLGGGKSGAYVFIVTHRETGKKFIMKLYALKILDAIQDRDVREIFTTCAMSGEYGFPIVHDYGTTQYEANTEFWKKFKASYISCVPIEKRIKDFKLYTRVYYIVTSFSEGSEVNKKNLLTYTPNEFVSILYQLAVMFKTAANKAPFFVHNDLHPGNIFIDDNYRGKLIYVDKNTQILGPRASLIDFDLAMSDAYKENLAKGREKTGKFLIQEAMITLLNSYFGVTNSIKIINYTSDLWTNPLIGNNDDFRLWYVYLIIFRIIDRYRKQPNFVTLSDPKKEGPQALDIEVVKNIIKDIQTADFNTHSFETFSGFVDCVDKHSKEDLTIKILCGYKEENVIKQRDIRLERIQEQIRIKAKNADQINYTKLLTGMDSLNDFIMAKIDFDNIKNITLDDVMKFANKVAPDLVLIKLLEFALKSVKELEIETYKNANTHFGLHNYRIGVTINLGQSEIKIPFYNKGETIMITLTQTAQDKKITVFIIGDWVEIKIENIIFGKTLIINDKQGLLYSLVGYFVNINEIRLNKETGEILLLKDGNKTTNDQARGYVNLFLNWGIQSSVKDVVNCPGIAFDQKDFMENVFPLIIVLLRYVYDIKGVRNAELIIANNEKDKYIEKRQDINVIEIIDNLRSNIDMQIKKEILKLYGPIQEEIETPNKSKDYFKIVRTNYKHKEFERELLRDNKITDANSLQQMINNVMIGNNKTNPTYDKLKFSDKIQKFMISINDLANFINNNKKEKAIIEMSEVTKSYGELMDYKGTIVNAYLNENQVKELYGIPDLANLLNTYNEVFDTIKQLEIKDNDILTKALKKLDNLLLTSINNLAITGTIGEYEYLYQLYNKFKTDGKRDIENAIGNLLNKIVNIIRANIKNAFEYNDNMESYIKFFLNIIYQRLKVKYRYLAGDWFTWEFTKRPEDMNNEIGGIKALYDNIMNLKNADIIQFINNVVYLLKYTSKSGDTKIEYVEYGNLDGIKKGGLEIGEREKYINENILIPLKDILEAKQIRIEAQHSVPGWLGWTSSETRILSIDILPQEEAQKGGHRKIYKLKS